jgi:hypothetical protein
MKATMLVLLGSALLAAALPRALALAADCPNNIVANAGFEKPYVAGWAMTTPTNWSPSCWPSMDQRFEIQTVSCCGLDAHSGRQRIELAPNKPSAACQTLATEPDLIYQLSFALARRGDDAK